mmetsp:Transcript_12305/g.18552  ORF Transcript_12305/g.18552 Transcript_12305/m.18552 type:complete len:108 (+) Transcript_12305:65-388(+)
MAHRMQRCRRHLYTTSNAYASSQSLSFPCIYQTSRTFGMYAKYKDAKKTFKPPTEERNLTKFVTWKTNLSAFGILSFACGVYYYTVKHFMSDGEERLRRMGKKPAPQ